jgi:hypothetical protein
MAMKGHLPGGGIASNKVVQKPVRTGTGSQSARPAGVAQIGNAWGNHATSQGRTNYTGERLHNDRNYQPTKFGNEIAANTTCGPGGSRTVYKTGSQDQYGSGGPPKPAGRDILGAFGPETSK